MDQLVGGLDGCPGGWVLVTTSASGGDRCHVEVVEDLASVIADLDAGRLAVAAIDIPIGLPERGPRRCDTEARKLIGPRSKLGVPGAVPRRARSGDIR